MCFLKTVKTILLIITQSGSDGRGRPYCCAGCGGRNFECRLGMIGSLPKKDGTETADWLLSGTAAAGGRSFCCPRTADWLTGMLRCLIDG